MSQLDITAEQLALMISHRNWSNDSLNRFAEAIRYRRAQMQYETRRSLRVGDAVKFTSNRNGRTYNGTVERVKIKYVIVRTAGQLWNVPANMLEIVA